VIARSLEPEILDTPGRPLEELRLSLGLVAQVNRRLGGLRALKRHLGPLSRQQGVLHVLDVGTGNGQTLREAAAWAARRGTPWRVVGLDRFPGVVRLARGDGSLPVVRGDGLALPFPSRVFDAVLCTLTLHHFGDEDAVSLLREMARVCRGIILVNDLERHRLHHLGARALAATVWRHCSVTRYDGPLSVLRSFTRAELAALGRRAGLSGVRVRRHFPFRLVLEARPACEEDR